MKLRSVHALLTSASLALALGTAPALANKPCIGASLPITGPTAWAADSISMGAEVAIAEINAKGGVLGQRLSRGQQCLGRDDLVDQTPARRLGRPHAPAGEQQFQRDRARQALGQAQQAARIGHHA